MGEDDPCGHIFPIITPNAKITDPPLKFMIGEVHRKHVSSWLLHSGVLRDESRRSCFMNEPRPGGEC